jgi:hypothetical protein
MYNKFEQVHKYIYTCLNMVIWSNIYKDALILDELCMYIKNIVLLIRKIWYTRKHIFTLLNLWDIWKGQKNVTCKNLLCSGLLDSSRTWVLSLPNNLILPSLQNKIKKSRKYYSCSNTKKCVHHKIDKVL